ncbi:MAG: PLP-dependent lyase/thiolase [Ilumatobacteraceae bacterium]
METASNTGWRCAVCGAFTEISQSLSWRCRNVSDGGHHAPQPVQPIAALRPLAGVGGNPFRAFRHSLMWDAFAAANGLDEAQRDGILADLDSRVATAAGTGFVTTPLFRADALSDELGFGTDGGVWVKDETGNVGGSHKARHLFGILAHLVTAEAAGATPWDSTSQRPPLAISSCGNAAIAAATLAKAVAWPLRVFVPTSASPAVLAALGRLDAIVVECARRAADAPGDPCVHRFREAVAAGAVPFGVQGTENAWCLDGGRTLGWELATQFEDLGGPPLDRLFVQVGGGAFAACAVAGFRMSGLLPRLHAVQTESCAPLDRAWSRAAELDGPRRAAAHWDECMWPWEDVRASAADGILDDETYDWLPVLVGMADGGGSPVVVSENDVLAANELAVRATGVDVSHTGTAGLAGLLAIRDEVMPDERVAVVFSGVRR